VVHGWPGLLAGGAALAVGNGLVSPSLSALLSRHSRPEDQGGTLGIGQSASSVARIVGPETGTLAFAALSPAAPYLGGAVVMALAALVGFTVRSEARDPV
jgi:MFS transporter, DHA1 family, tetracycline resistance protein